MEARETIRLIAEFSSALRGCAPQSLWTAFDAVKSASKDWSAAKSEGPVLESIHEVEDLLAAVARGRNLGSLYSQVVPRRAAKSTKKPAEQLLEALVSLHKALTVMQVIMLRHLDGQLQKERTAFLVADRERLDQPELDIARRLTGLKVVHVRSAQAVCDQVASVVEESEGSAHVRVVVEGTPDAMRGAVALLRGDGAAITRGVPLVLLGKGEARALVPHALPLQARDALVVATTDAAVLRALVEAPGLLLDGERVDETIDDVHLKRAKVSASLQLMVSNYRLAFVQTSAGSPLLELDVPLGSVLRVELGEAKGKAKGARQTYKLLCRDFRSVSFTVPERAPKLAKVMLKYGLEGALDSYFAPAHCDNAEKGAAADAGWATYTLYKEMQRQGLLFGGKWKMVSQEDFDLCAAYPLNIALPASLSQSRLPAAAKHRVDGRFPVLCWFHATSGVALARAAHETSDADAALSDSEKDDVLAAIAKANPRGKLLIADVSPNGDIRPERKAALKEKYTLRPLHMPPTAELVAVFRRLLDAWPALLAADAAARVEDTGYPGLVRKFVSHSSELAAQLRAGVSVLVQSDDGADAAALVACLVQVHLDPYYRTMAGFAVLVEREWLATASAIGWRGKSKRRARDEDLLAAPFVLFLDCVYQLVVQQPAAFELSEAYLLALVGELYTGRFGSFLVTGERERIKHKLAHRTHSVWQHLAASASAYRSAVYVSELPVSSLTRSGIEDEESTGSATRLHGAMMGAELSVNGSQTVLWHGYFLAHADRSALDRFTDALDKATRRRNALPSPAIALSKTHLASLPEAPFVAAENVAALKRLDLADNLLNTLPLGVARLTALTALSLARNRFTAFPRFALFHVAQHLHALTELDLSGNQLSEFYADALVRLRVLRLDNNRLGELSPSISQLTCLTALHAAGNAPLASLPWDLPESLSVLALSGGALTKVPSSLGRLTRLDTLLLDANALDALPDDLLVRLTALATLHLSRNPLGRRRPAAPPTLVKGQRAAGAGSGGAAQDALGALDFLRQTSTPTIAEPSSPLDFLRQTSTPAVEAPAPAAPPSVGPLDFLRQTSTQRAVSPGRPHAQDSPAAPAAGAGSGNSLQLPPSSSGSGGSLTQAAPVAVGPLDFLRQTTADEARPGAPTKASMSPLDFLRETSAPTLSPPPDRLPRGSEIVGRVPRGHGAPATPSAASSASHSTDSSPRVATPVAAAVDPLAFLRQTAPPDAAGSESPQPRHLRSSPAAPTDSAARLVPVRVSAAPTPVSLTGTDSELVLPRLSSTRLATLHLAQLELVALPSRLWPLTHLTELNVAANKLESLPPQLGDLTRLRLLNAEANQLARLPLELARLTLLEELRLAGNALHELSPVVGRLSALTLLDLARNPLAELPASLGQLRALRTLGLDGVELKSPQKEAAAQGVGVLAGLLQEQAAAQERLWRARVVVLGEPGVGKTSLVRALLRRGKGRATEATGDALLAEAWTFDAVADEDAPAGAKTPQLRPLAGAKAGGARPTPVTLSVFDLSAPELNAALPLILTERTLYLLVCNLARPLAEARVEQWLRAVAAKSGKNAVVVVGTHTDDRACTKDFLAEQLAELERKRSPVLKAVRSVSAETGRGVEELRADIEQLALRLDKMGENVAAPVLALERLALAERRAHAPPVLSMEQWRDMAAACLVPPDAVPAATALLTNLGSIAHYPVPQLRDVVLLEPYWPLEALAALLQAPPALALGPDGFLESAVLDHVWREPRFPPSAHALLVAVFLHFDVLFTSSADLTDKAALLTRHLLPAAPPAAFPALWPHTWHSNAPVIIAPAGSSSAVYGRRYRFAAVPRGFLGRLMGRLLRFTAPKCLWQSGMLLDRDGTRAFLAVEADSLSLFLHAPSYVPQPDAFAVLRQLYTVVAALIRDWYRVPAQLSFYCPHCLASGAARDAVHEVPAATVNDAVARGLTALTCPLGENVTLQLDRLAPDMLFVAPERTLPHAALKLQEKLGQGGFATVYKAEHQGAAVAVKELAINALSQTGEESEAAEKPGAREELFDCFRHEASVMAALSHPHIIYLVGYTLTPPSLVMELMNGGDLHNLLHASERPLAWPARMKLIHDVATAIAYMHSREPPVLHRDLKSPNVLLCRDERGRVTAKLADFGTAVVLYCGTALGRVVDNPMWLAPEVLENLEYSVAADTYAFAIIAWEAASRAEFFPELRFWTQQEQHIIQGVRPPIPADTPAAFRAIIEACWAPRPSQRPAMAVVLERLTAALPPDAVCELAP